MHKSLVATAILSALLAACSSTPIQTAPVENRTVAPVLTTPPKASDIVDNKVVTVAPPKTNLFSPAELKNPNNLLSKRSVYFGYDSFTVELDFVSILEAHSRFLKANPTYKMLIQGNADERGSREYNLALGQKRADAIKKNISMMGAKEEQIEAVSLGEEKPKNTGHDEAAWTENRRGDILYSGEF